MAAEFSNAELEAYLEEALAAERMAAVEDALRHDEALQQRLMVINGQRDAGLHSVGEIWRRHRLSCPTREQLGSYLLGVLPKEAADYVKFHVEEIGCRYCSASSEDLRSQQAADAGATNQRRQRYYQSSAGYLRRQE